MSRGYEPAFDMDRQYGEEGEGTVRDVLGLRAHRIEVKRKSYVDEQFYVEWEHDPGRRGRYKPSGLQVTKAAYWAYVVGDTGLIVLVPTVLLRQARELGDPAEETDGSCPTRGTLVSLDLVLTGHVVVASATEQRRYADWLCRDCVGQAVRPMYPAVRDGVCGYHWLERWKAEQ